MNIQVLCINISRVVTWTTKLFNMKWLSFCRILFQINCFEWKWLYLISNYLKFVAKDLTDKVFTQNRWQAIIWSSEGLFLWCTLCAWLGLNELTSLLPCLAQSPTTIPITSQQVSTTRKQCNQHQWKLIISAATGSRLLVIMCGAHRAPSAQWAGSWQIAAQ